jgi:hypothetical protein
MDNTYDFTAPAARQSLQSSIELLNAVGDNIPPSQKQALLAPLLAKMFPGSTPLTNDTTGSEADNTWKVSQQKTNSGSTISQVYNDLTQEVTPSLIKAENIPHGIGTVAHELNDYITNIVGQPLDDFTNNNMPLSDEALSKVGSYASKIRAIKSSMPTDFSGSKGAGNEWKSWLTSHNIISGTWGTEGGANMFDFADYASISNFTINPISEWS